MKSWNKPPSVQSRTIQLLQTLLVSGLTLIVIVGCNPGQYIDRFVPDDLPPILRDPLVNAAEEAAEEAMEGGQEVVEEGIESNREFLLETINLYLLDVADIRADLVSCPSGCGDELAKLNNAEEKLNEAQEYASKKPDFRGSDIKRAQEAAKAVYNNTQAKGLMNSAADIIARIDLGCIARCNDDNKATSLRGGTHDEDQGITSFGYHSDESEPSGAPTLSTPSAPTTGPAVLGRLVLDGQVQLNGSVLSNGNIAGTVTSPLFPELTTTVSIEVDADGNYVSQFDTYRADALDNLYLVDQLEITDKSESPLRTCVLGVLLTKSTDKLKNSALTDCVE